MATAPTSLPSMVDRAAAHALHDAGMFQGTAGEARQDQRFLGTDVIQNSDDLDLELFDLVAGKHRSADAAHAGADVLQRKERRLRGKSGGEREGRRDHEARHVTIVPGEGKKIPP